MNPPTLPGRHHYKIAGSDFAIQRFTTGQDELSQLFCFLGRFQTDDDLRTKFIPYSSVLATSVLFGCYKQTTLVQQNNSGLGEIVWADEFNNSGLPDPLKWGFDVGGHGWGNRELQYYTDRRKENARVENGNLIIEARRDNWDGHEYTSARLISKDKAAWTYGRFEVRATLPSGRGTWPAIWMLPNLKTYGSGRTTGRSTLWSMSGLIQT